MNLNRAQILTLDLMKYHGLHDWSFGFDRSISRLGYCNYRMRRISLSRHATLVNSEAETLNVILHEVAHALVGPGFGHGPVWKAKARSIGCNAERTGKIEVQAPAKYKITCTSCSKVYNYYRRPKWIHRIDAVWCTRCGKDKSKGKFTLEVVGEVGISFVDKINP